MKKIKMIEDSPGYLDGVNKTMFLADNVYSIPDEITQEIADAFLSMEWAENVLEIKTPEDGKATIETPEDKAAPVETPEKAKDTKKAKDKK